MTETFKNVLISAMDNASEGITISDATQPDNPLIYVNKGFLKMTGYLPEDVLHKNCRFLQGDVRKQEAAGKIREAVKEQRSVQVELLNFKKDGTPFYNRLSITPLFNHAKELTHFIGVQEDISLLKEKEAAAYRMAREHLTHSISVQVLEETRDAIAKELHDNINQLLATAKLMLSLRTQSHSETSELMQQSSGLVNQAIEEIRNLTQRLVQPDWEARSLLQSVQTLVDSLQNAVPFSIHLHTAMDETRLSDEKKLTLYRIIQESLNNIIKYANPCKVMLSLADRDGSVELKIEDDGAGFDKAEMPAGIGLRNMRSRLQNVSGSLAIDTSPARVAACTSPFRWHNYLRFTAARIVKKPRQFHPRNPSKIPAIRDP